MSQKSRNLLYLLAAHTWHLYTLANHTIAAERGDA